MTGSNHHIAVLTGDLVNSTALSKAELELAFAALMDCAEAQAKWVGGALHLSRHRGDGWQIILAQPRFALRSALAFRASLRALGAQFDSYIGIAEGAAPKSDFSDLNTETSGVFTQSGRSLEQIKSHDDPLFFAHADAGMKQSVLTLADCLSQQWTAAQAAAILAQFEPNSSINYTEIAKTLGKSRQAVTKASRAAHMEALLISMRQYEADYA